MRSLYKTQSISLRGGVIYLILFYLCAHCSLFTLRAYAQSGDSSSSKQTGHQHTKETGHQHTKETGHQHTKETGHQHTKETGHQHAKETLRLKVSLHEISVSKVNREGKKWDPFGTPDLLVEVWNDDTLIFSTFKKNSFKAQWSALSSVVFEHREGQRVKFKVFDKDLKDDDLIEEFSLVPSSTQKNLNTPMIFSGHFVKKLRFTIKVTDAPTSTHDLNLNHREPVFSFKSLYQRPLYQHSYFIPVIATITVATAVAITTFTAGSGAPAAAMGVSSVASWIAGGGAGSYMVGLSTIGGWFGGNAILGAAILNATSAALFGTGSFKLAAPLLTQSMIYSLEFGSYYLDFKEAQLSILTFNYPLILSHDIGSEQVQTELKQFKDLNHQKKKSKITAQTHTRLLSALMEGLLLKRGAVRERPWRSLSPVQREDYLARLLLMRQLSADKNVLIDSVAYIEDRYAMKHSFLSYLKAITAIEASSFTHDMSTAHKHYQRAKTFSERSLELEPGVLESIMILAIAHEGLGLPLPDHVSLLKKYNKDHYQSHNKRYTVYALLGDIIYSNKSYPTERSLHLYLKAWDEMGLLTPKLNKGLICVKIARAYHKMGKDKEAKKFKERGYSYIKKEENVQRLREEFRRIFEM